MRNINHLIAAQSFYRAGNIGAGDGFLKLYNPEWHRLAVANRERNAKVVEVKREENKKAAA